MKERPILFSGPMVRAILEGRKTQTRRVVKDPLAKNGGQFCVEYADDDPNMLVHVHDPKCGGYCDYACSYPCPYGKPGDRLWVRETHAQVSYLSASPCGTPRDPFIVYRADGADLERLRARNLYVERWIPSIHMCRRDSRIDLEVVSVRVERLQAISTDDALAEGVEPGTCSGCGSCSGSDCCDPREDFMHLWDSINGDRQPSHISRRRVKDKPTDQWDAAHPPKPIPSPYSWAANPWVWAVEFKRV